MTDSTDIEKFDVKQQKKFLIDQGWAYTGKFPHQWSDPAHEYDEARFVDITQAVEVARTRLQMLRATASEEMIACSRVLRVVEQVRAAFVDAGCAFESGELAAIDRLAKSLKEEFRLASGHRKAGSFGTRRKERKSA